MLLSGVKTHIWYIYYIYKYINIIYLSIYIELEKECVLELIVYSIQYAVTASR